MSRDMQIGLLLAVGFLALVGGVLYYRIEHPDELEQLLTGSETQVAGTNSPAPDTSKPDMAPATTTPAGTSTPPGTGTLVAGATTTPPAPAHNPPPLETPFSSVATPPSLTNSNPSVVQTAAPATNPSKPDSKPNLAPALVGGGAVALGMGLMGSDKKSDENKAPSTSRTSLPVDSPGVTPSAGAPPSIALDTVPKNTTPPGDTKKPTESVIKPDTTASTVVPPGLSPPPMTPPSATGATLPTAPTAGAIVMSDPTKSPTIPEKKSDELPQPPTVTPSTAGGISFDVTKPPVPATTSTPAMSPLNLNPQPPATTTAPGLGAPPAAANPPLNTTITPSSTPGVSSVPTPAPTTDADGFRTYPPKVGLGKPLAESEAAMREKRWGDAAGNPAPIIPSSVETRSNVVTAPLPITGASQRAVVQDSYMPRERAMNGETFSSLSQRLYGDTNYAVALAAFNKEEGFVKLDQPTPGEWVAKPNREILDQKYPHLVRRLTPNNLNQSSMTMLANNANTRGSGTPAATTANTNLPTYRVGKGEQLFEVAKKTLGDGYRWSEIYALNKDLLRDSTELRPDMVLKLPAEAKK